MYTIPQTALRGSLLPFYYSYINGGFVHASTIGSWQKNATISGFASYVNNSANLTNANKGRTVLFYDWNGDWTINHAALFVADNQKTSNTKLDGNVTGDLIDQHSINYKRVIWNADLRNDRRKSTRIYAFQLPL